MCNREERGSRAENRKATAGAAMKQQLRRSSPSHDFNIAPEDLLGVTRAERFHGGFLCREAPGKMDRRIPTPLAIRNLTVGEDTVEEPLSVSFDCRRDARYIGGVQAKANDVRHSRDDTSDTRALFRMAADGRGAGSCLS